MENVIAEYISSLPHPVRMLYTWYVQPCEFLQAHWWVIPEADRQGVCLLYLRERERERQIINLQCFNFCSTGYLPGKLMQFWVNSLKNCMKSLQIESQIEVLIILNPKSWIDAVCNLVEYMEGEELLDFWGIGHVPMSGLSDFKLYLLPFRSIWRAWGHNFILWLPPLYIRDLPLVFD